MIRNMLKSLGQHKKPDKGENQPPPAYLSHPLILPPGETEESIFNYLSSYHFPDEPVGEMQNYLKEDFRRFLYTLQIIPKGCGKLLDIGANPYFTTMLLKKFTEYDVYCTNFFGSETPKSASQHKLNVDNERIAFKYHTYNVEGDNIPYPEKTFDVILFCEVIEHLTQDPLKAIINVKKMLKPGGCLILTTPNVSRLENVAKMLAGANIYDPYSGYGIYGRHNREYNCHEINQLLTHAGFTIEHMFTIDVHENRSTHYCNLNNIKSLLKHRKNDIGQYIFLRAKNLKEANSKKPSWLYRSYPSQEIVP